MRSSTRTVADVLTYAGALTVAVALPGAAVGLAFRGNLVAAKRLLFLVGFALLAYSSLHLRPAPSTDDGTGQRDRYDPRGLQALVSRTLPASVRPPPEERVPVHAKLLLAGVAMLLASLLLEVGGVGAG